jgi:hypothetical protein
VPPIHKQKKITNALHSTITSFFFFLFWERKANDIWEKETHLAIYSPKCLEFPN